VLFISRMIYDPNYTWSSTGQPRPNHMGRTVGLTFYTPKFWNCQTIRPDSYRHTDPRCPWPNRHMSYKGYLYWTGPKRRYQLNYMGPLHLGDERRWFKVFKHGRYTRWLDDGSGVKL
jgi:hypothetical protein